MLVYRHGRRDQRDAIAASAAARGSLSGRIALSCSTKRMSPRRRWLPALRKRIRESGDRDVAAVGRVQIHQLERPPSRRIRRAALSRDAGVRDNDVVILAAAESRFRAFISEYSAGTGSIRSTATSRAPVVCLPRAGR